MLITKQKQWARITSILLLLNSSNGKSVLEVLNLLRYTHGNNRRCCHKQDAWDESQTGKQGVLSYVGLCVYVWEEEPGSESVVSSVMHGKKPSLFPFRYYELTTSKELNLISYRRHSEACLKRSRIPIMGFVDFPQFPRGVRGCLLLHISVCSSCCVSGDSHAGPLIETPLPRYSVINKRRSKESSKWPFVSDNSTSITMPLCSANTFIQTSIS